MPTPSKSFRVIWMGVICAGWIFLIWLGTHRSEFPHVFHRYSWNYFFLLALLFCLNVGVSVLPRQLVYLHRRTILLLGTSVCGAVIVAEAYCRVADPLGISYFQETRRYRLDRVADPDLVVRHRRSWRATYQGVEVRFNELGFRDDPIHPKERSEYRILVLGDSVPFGWGVVQEKIFPVRLQHILTTDLGRPVRVINAGIAGYNTVQEHTLLWKEGLALEPDLVLLLYHPNDIEPTLTAQDTANATALGQAAPLQVLSRLWEESWLYRLAVYAGRYGWYGRRSAADLDRHEFRQEVGWRASMESLRRMAQLCEEHQVPLVVFYVRLLTTPFNDALLTDVTQAVTPVPVADMSPWFADEDKRVFMNSRVDPHLNAKGHHVTAESMANYLVHEFGLQPAPQSWSIPHPRRDR